VKRILLLIVLLGFLFFAYQVDAQYDSQKLPDQYVINAVLKDAAARIKTPLTQDNVNTYFTFFQTTTLDCANPKHTSAPAQLRGYKISVIYPIPSGQAQFDYRSYADRLFLCTTRGPGPPIKIDRPTDQTYFTETPPASELSERGKPPAMTVTDPLIRHERARFGYGTLATLSYSPDGKMLAVGGSMGIYLLTDDLKPIAHLNGGTRSVSNLIWSPTGKQIAALVSGDAIQLWDVASGTVEPIGALSINTFAKMRAEKSRVFR